MERETLLLPLWRESTIVAQKEVRAVLLHSGRERALLLHKGIESIIVTQGGGSIIVTLQGDREHYCYTAGG